jgi:hypothetical protein
MYTTLNEHAKNQAKKKEKKTPEKETKVDRAQFTGKSWR